MREKLLLTVILIAAVMLAVGCTEQQKSPSMGDYLIPNDPNWIEAFGDSEESQMGFNLAKIRDDQKRLYQYIIVLHKTDPNAVTMDDRITKLEAEVLAMSTIKYQERLLKIVEEYEKKIVESNAVTLESRVEALVKPHDGIDVIPEPSPDAWTVVCISDNRYKINEIIDVLNKRE